MDQTWPDTQPTLIEVTTGWPAFALPADSPLRSTMIEAANAFGVDTEPKIANPSNIGNYLAGLGIPVTAGFGVTFTGLHATDERFRIDTVPMVQTITMQYCCGCSPSSETTGAPELELVEYPAGRQATGGGARWAISAGRGRCAYGSAHDTRGVRCEQPRWPRRSDRPRSWGCRVSVESLAQPVGQAPSATLDRRGGATVGGPGR